MTTDTVALELSHEWAAAREVQQRFMTSSNAASHYLAGAVDVSARCRQVRELGGDFYHLWSLPDRRLAFAVGDASGKGLAAALMISNVQSSLRTAASFTGGHGAPTVEAVNRQVHGSSLENRYATLFYAVLDPESNALRYVNAGHPPALVLHPSGAVTWLESGGAPVGLFAGWRYQEEAVQLHAGDLVLAYSDGLLEAVNAAGEQWGLDGIQQAAAECGNWSADRVAGFVFARMDRYTRGHQTDDAALVALRIC